MHCLRLRLFTVACALLAAPACATYDVAQSSLVPLLTPPPQVTDQGRVDVQVNYSTPTFLSRPRQTASTTAGLYVPRHQVEVSGSFRWRPWGGVRVRYLEGFSEGALSTYPSNIEAPDANVTAFGAGPFFRLVQDDNFSLFTGVDFTYVWVPSRTRIIGCEDNGLPPPSCVANIGDESQDSDEIIVFSWQTAGSFRLTQSLRFIGSLSFQNSPTNRAEFKTVIPDNAEVREGNINAIVGAGMEIRFFEVLSVVPMVQFPIIADPVRYGPIVSIGLRGAFGKWN